jgi:hypothetical protein
LPGARGWFTDLLAGHKLAHQLAKFQRKPAVGAIAHPTKTLAKMAANANLLVCPASGTGCSLQPNVVSKRTPEEGLLTNPSPNCETARPLQERHSAQKVPKASTKPHQISKQTGWSAIRLSKICVEILDVLGWSLEVSSPGYL